MAFHLLTLIDSLLYDKSLVNNYPFTSKKSIHKGHHTKKDVSFTRYVLHPCVGQVHEKD